MEGMGRTLRRSSPRAPTEKLHVLHCHAVQLSSLPYYLLIPEEIEYSLHH